MTDPEREELGIHRADVGLKGSSPCKKCFLSSYLFGPGHGAEHEKFTSKPDTMFAHVQLPCYAESDIGASQAANKYIVSGHAEADGSGGELVTWGGLKGTLSR